MKSDKSDDAKDKGSPEGDADIVELGGETTAAATGSAEIGAVTSNESESNAGPVGAETMVQVAGEPDSSGEI
jgi:hypothetical protein